MINCLHALLHRPERGWDPVSAEHSRLYSEQQWAYMESTNACLDRLEKHIGPLRGKSVLDLGGGPGQFSVALAARGAHVTWHDVSRNYLEQTNKKAADCGVTVALSLGYLEDAKRFGPGKFDLVFNRGCWRYSRSDRNFARLLFYLIAPGGAGYIDAVIGPDHSDSWWRRLQYRLNARLSWKIGHPNPPPQRLQQLFSDTESTIVDFGSTSTNDRFLIIKSTGS